MAPKSDSRQFLIGTAPGRLYMTYETQSSITQMVPKSESKLDLNNLNTLNDSQEELSSQEIPSVHSRNLSLDDVEILSKNRKESADLSAASSEEFEVTDKEQ